MAQPGSAPALGAGGRRFKSGRPDSGNEFVALVKDTAPPLVAPIAKNAPDDPEKVWDAILGAVEERASDDGMLKFANRVLLAVGRA